MSDFEDKLNKLAEKIKEQTTKAQNVEQWKAEETVRLENILKTKAVIIEKTLGKYGGSASVKSRLTNSTDRFVVSVLTLKIPSSAPKTDTSLSVPRFSTLNVKSELGNSLLQLNALTIMASPLDGFPKMIREEDLGSEIEGAVIQLLERLLSPRREAESET